MEKVSLARPALSAGLFCGALAGTMEAIWGPSSLCSCCLSGALVGMIAAYLTIRDHGSPVSGGTGLLVGGLAGLYAALIRNIMVGILQLTGARLNPADMIAELQEGSNLPAETLDILSTLESLPEFYFLVDLFMATAFLIVAGAAGGALGVALFQGKRKQPDSPAPAVAPPPYQTPNIQTQSVPKPSQAQSLRKPSEDSIVDTSTVLEPPEPDTSKDFDNPNDTASENPEDRV